jgi:hypothetical protein
VKLTILALAFTLLIVPNNYRVNRQDKPTPPVATQEKFEELLKLEAQFKKLDEESDPVTIEVTGDNESSGNIKITVERSVATTTTTNKSDENSGQKNKKEKTKTETLVDVDLSKVQVPDEYINAKMSEVFSNPSKSNQCPGVTVQKIEPSIDYKVMEDYTYPAGAYSITAWKDFTYDRASIPRIFWVIIDKDSLTNVAPLFHDLLYRHGGVLPNNRVAPYRKFTRREADDLFLEIMRKCGVGYFRRMAAYKAVRELAESSWQKQ